MLHMAGMLESATLMDVELHIIVLMGLNWLGGLIDTVRLMDRGAPRSYLPACWLQPCSALPLKILTTGRPFIHLAATIL